MDALAAPSRTAKIAETFAECVREMKQADQRRTANDLSLDFRLVPCQSKRSSGPQGGDPRGSNESRPIGSSHAISAQTTDHAAVVKHQRRRGADVRGLEMCHARSVGGPHPIA